MTTLTHLQRPEAESIRGMNEANARNGRTVPTDTRLAKRH